MQTYTYVSKGKFELMEKPKPVLMHERDAIVKVTLASICSSDIRITGNKTLILSRGFEIGAHSFDECVREFAFDAAAAANLVRTLCVMGQIG